MGEEQIKQMLTLIYKVFKDPETAESIAQMYWGLFTKLQEKGFTKEEAFQILLTFNIPQGK